MKSYVLLGAIFASTACRESEVAGPNCPDIGIAAITVIALDEVNGAPTPTRGVVIVSDGAYADTAVALGTPPRYAAAFNRPGTYTVTVAVAGYRPWQLAGVVVNRAACNLVTTVPIAAWLQR